MRRQLFFALMLSGTMNAFAQKFGWSELGTGTNGLNANATIRALTGDKQGNLYAAGLFTNADGKYYVAKWDGSKWSELGTDSNALNANDYIYSVFCGDSGKVYASGTFTNQKGDAYIAMWNGTRWSDMSATSKFFYYVWLVDDICADTSGNIYGRFSYGGFSRSPKIGRWDGVEWIEVGRDSGSWYNDFFTDKSGHLFKTTMRPYTHFKRWNDSVWVDLTNDSDNVYPLQNYYPNGYTIDADGNLYAVGVHSEGTVAYYVARWDGKKWSQIGPDIPSAQPISMNNYATPIHVDSAKNVYTAGDLKNSTFYHYITKYDGHAWSEFHGDIGKFYPNAVYQFYADASGSLYAAGDFEISFNSRYVAKFGPLSSTGIMDPDGKEKALDVFPNPSSHYITVNCDMELVGSTYHILDQLGKEVLKGRLLNNSTVIDIQSLYSGVYFFHVLNQPARSLKVIKY